MPDLPVVCALTPAAVKARREGLLSRLVEQAEARAELPDGYRLRFAASGHALASIAETIDAERQCCRFLRFSLTVEPDGGPVSLDLTGPSGTREFLAALLGD
jgi:hypothetical protein